ncbi:MAG: extracellular solute-binding protein, partial [Anaerolineae bacterium]|nr:extracellular solute-binding protein [Anaerolineae bacterium]
MKKTRLYAILAVVLTLTLILSACGGAATPAPAPTEAPAAAEPTAAEAPTATPAPAPTDTPAEEAMAEPTEAPTEAPVAEEPVATLKIWADDTRTPILLGLADDFLAEYGVKLEVEDLGVVQDIRSQAIIAIPAGEGPDIFVGVHDWLGALIESGLVAPIDLGDKNDEFVQSALDAFTYTDGQLYG